MADIDTAAEAERLRELRAKIEDMLRQADTCAYVVLAGRAGRFESFAQLWATWSNLRFESHPKGGSFIGLRSRRGDYANRPPGEQQQHLAWSVGVVSGIAQILGTTGLQWLEAAARFDDMTGAEHTPLVQDDPRRS